MSPSSITPRPLNVEPVDKDLAEQALPGHGIPSQDPDAAAQIPITAAESDREAHSALMGGGLIAGAATGAAVGAAVAGPVGVLVGSTVGLVAGALGGAAAGSLVKPEDHANTNPDLADNKVHRSGETQRKN